MTTDTTKLADEIHAFLADAPKGKPHEGYRYGELLAQALAALRAPDAEPVAIPREECPNCTRNKSNQLAGIVGWAACPIHDAAINGPAACSGPIPSPSQEGVGSAGSGATLSEGLADALVNADYVLDNADPHRLVHFPAELFIPLTAAARSAQGMADELARERARADANWQTCENLRVQLAEARKCNVVANRLLLTAAASALRGYQYGNASTELAKEVADAIDAALKTNAKT